MFTSIILPPFGLLSIYHTFYTLITHIPNKILLYLCTVLTVFLQIVFADQILPYNSNFNTKNFSRQYIYPCGKTIILTSHSVTQCFLLLFLSTDQRQKRSLTQDVKLFLNNTMFQYTNPLSFETEPHIIHTIPLAREHCDFSLYYFRCKTLETLRSQNPFETIFNPVQGINTGTYYRTSLPQNIASSIQDVFITYMDKLKQHNENIDTPEYLPSHLESPKEKHDFFEVPDLETKISRHNNPHNCYNEIKYKSKKFNTDSFKTLYLMKIQYQK